LKRHIRFIFSIAPQLHSTTFFLITGRFLYPLDRLLSVCSAPPKKYIAIALGRKIPVEQIRMKRVHWFDDANVLSSSVCPESMVVYSVKTATTGNTTKRLQEMYDKVDDVYRRMNRVRRKIRQLSYEMDEQLEETRQTKCQLNVIQCTVDQLSRETEEYDRQLKAYYDYEREHCVRRQQMPVRCRATVN
jgi:predicted transcriptional regulator